jgi:hypothetical protein
MTRSGEDAIRAYLEAAEDFQSATNAELHAELERPAEKQAAILRLIAGVNPLTNRQHSAWSAEDVVDTDQAYFAYRVQQIALVLDRMQCEAAMHAARYTVLRTLEAERHIGEYVTTGDAT